MGKPTGLAQEQLRALDRLMAVPGSEQFYLAGGSALTLHLGHRRSVDLDLFSFDGDVDLERFRDGLAAALPGLGIKGATDATLRIEIEGVRVDLVRYPYPLLELAQTGPSEVPVAGLADLAAMKLAAIARRGLRRDFWDLFSIAESGLSLRHCVTAYQRRYGAAQSDLYHVLRSLTYFVDAERDAVLPLGMDEAQWERVKAFFEERAPALLGV